MTRISPNSLVWHLVGSLVIAYLVSQNNAILFPHTTHLLNNLFQCPSTIPCMFPNLGLHSHYSLWIILFSTYSNTALFPKCHTPSPPWHLLHHFPLHPQWSSFLGLDYVFIVSVNTLPLCISVCLWNCRRASTEDLTFLCPHSAWHSGRYSNNVLIVWMGG